MKWQEPFSDREEQIIFNCMRYTLKDTLYSDLASIVAKMAETLTNQEAEIEKLKNELEK